MSDQKKGRETDPINEVSLAALLGLPEIALNFIVGKPKKDNRSLKVKSFTKRVRRA